MDISNIFPAEAPIEMSLDYQEDLKKFDQSRQKYNADKACLEKEAAVIDIDNISDISNGRIRIDINGARLKVI